MLLEASKAWHSDEPISASVHAAARDLRHTQYVLALEAERTPETVEEQRHCQVTARIARRIGKLAAELEAALAPERR